VVQEISDAFPENSNYLASNLKIQTLAARFFARHADSFDGTEDQLRIVAELIQQKVYMDQKEMVRVAATKSLSSLFSLMATMPLKDNLFFQSAMNYESYLILMNGLILVLTDENPEIRAFVINQELSVLFSRELHLESPTLSKLTLYDTNDYVALDILFERLTEQVLTFKEIQMGSSALQLDDDAL
jgi:hypothetical protein